MKPHGPMVPTGIPEQAAIIIMLQLTVRLAVPTDRIEKVHGRRSASAVHVCGLQVDELIVRANLAPSLLRSISHILPQSHFGFSRGCFKVSCQDVQGLTGDQPARSWMELRYLSRWRRGGCIFSRAEAEPQGC